MCRIKGYKKKCDFVTDRLTDKVIDWEAPLLKIYKSTIIHEYELSGVIHMH